MTRRFDDVYKKIYEKYDGKYGDLVEKYATLLIDVENIKNLVNVELEG